MLARVVRKVSSSRGQVLGLLVLPLAFSWRVGELRFTELKAVFEAAGQAPAPLTSPIVLAPNSVIDRPLAYATVVAQAKSLVVLGAGFPINVDPASVPPPGFRETNTLIGFSRAEATGLTSQLSVPQRVGRFQYPLLGGFPDGSMILFWAEADTVPAVKPVPDTATSRVLWYSRYRSGKWAVPRPLVAGDAYLRWTDDTPISSFFDGDSYNVVIPIRRHRYDGMTWVRATTNSIAVSELPREVVGSAIYGAMASAGQNTFVALYAGSADARGPARAGLVLTTSDDGGRVWKEPVLLERAAMWHAAQPMAVRTADSTLYVAWISTSVGPGTPQGRFVRYLSTRDRGRTWSPLRSFPITAGQGAPRLVPGGCGEVYLVLNNRHSQLPRNRLVMFTRDTAVDLPAVFPATSGVDMPVSVTLGPDGAAYLTWTTFALANGRETSMRTLVSQVATTVPGYRCRK
jgi:hypothetical protein